MIVSVALTDKTTLECNFHFPEKYKQSSDERRSDQAGLKFQRGDYAVEN